MNDRSDGEPSIYESIPGGAELLQWFGCVPTFHDAEILALTLNRRGESLLRIHGWLTPFDPASRVFPEDTKHAVVTFTLEGIMDLQLECFSHQNVIGGLVLRRAPDRPDRRSFNSLERGPEDIEIELEHCFGLCGRLRMRSVSLAFRPGGPTEEDR